MISAAIWEYFNSILRGVPEILQESKYEYQIDRAQETWESWEDWYREVVWYGNKKGAYIYGNEEIVAQYAGHY